MSLSAFGSLAQGLLEQRAAEQGTTIHALLAEMGPQTAKWDRQADPDS